MGMEVAKEGWRGRKPHRAIEVPTTVLLTGGCRSRPASGDGKDHLQTLVVWSGNSGIRCQSACGRHRIGHIWLSLTQWASSEGFEGQKSPFWGPTAATVSAGHTGCQQHPPMHRLWLLVSVTIAIALAVCEHLFPFIGTCHPHSFLVEKGFLLKHQIWEVWKESQPPV